MTSKCPWTPRSCFKASFKVARQRSPHPRRPKLDSPKPQTVQGAKSWGPDPQRWLLSQMVAISSILDGRGLATLRLMMFPAWGDQRRFPRGGNPGLVDSLDREQDTHERPDGTMAIRGRALLYLLAI